MMTITYPVHNGIYVNVTNRCPCACTFCLRQNGESVYGSDSLWLEREPTVKEVCDSIDTWDLNKYNEKFQKARESVNFKIRVEKISEVLLKEHNIEKIRKIEAIINEKAKT